MAPSVPAKPSCPRCHESWLLENASKSKRRWQPSDLVSVDKISSDHKCVRCRQVQFLRSTSVSPNCRAQSHPLVWWVIAEVWQLVVCLISLSLSLFPFYFSFWFSFLSLLCKLGPKLSCKLQEVVRVVVRYSSLQRNHQRLIKLTLRGMFGTTEYLWYYIF